MRLLTFTISTCLFLICRSDLFAQTPDFIELQGYLYDASLTGTSNIGIGVQNVWSLPGGQGEHVKIVDVERGWNLNHEDLPIGIPLIHGISEPGNEHGTAVLGILVGQDNGFGVTGMCSSTSIKVSSRWEGSELTPEQEDPVIAAAVAAARLQLDVGDVLLIEAQAGTGHE